MRARTRPDPAPGIFVSYRRDDTAGFAGRLFDRLTERFGRDSVFMDIDTIRPGHDFSEDIERALSGCTACIVLIGRRWLTIASADGVRRLDDPTDFVRLEVAAAIRRGIAVFPVLVEGATPPPAESLPDELRGIAGRQSIELSSERWNYDVGRLLLALDETFGRAPGSRRRPNRSRRYFSLAALTAILLTVMAAIGWIATRPSGDPADKAASAEGGETSPNAPCGGTLLCGTYDVTMSLTQVDGELGDNVLWGISNPRPAGTPPDEWTGQAWVFGPPAPNTWTIPARPVVEGTLKDDGTYVSKGKAGCDEAKSADIVRELSVQSTDPVPVSPADGFRGEMLITWACAGVEPFQAIFAVSGRASD